MTEDATLQRVLEFSEPGSATSSTALLFGELSDMPGALQAQLQRLPNGLHELDDVGGEIQVHKRSDATTSSYTLIRLDADTVVMPFLLWLTGGTAVAVALAIAFSLGLARRFSKPVETIINSLRQDRPVATDHQDILEFSELLDELDAHRSEQSARLLQEANFAKSVSHELRTPITVVVGALDLLLNSSLSTKDHARLLRIKRATDNMRWTVEALLSLSRAERQTQHSDLDFASALRASIAQMEVNLQPGVTVSTAIDGHPRSRQEWVPLLVALQTLIANAVAHTRTGDICIRVTQRDAHVIDTGAGMTPAELERVRSNRPPPGRLGIAMVHLICERCDWSLRIQSNPSGTEVSLLFTQAYARPESATAHA